ncbi:MAG: M20 family metallopeptidase [Hyphomicrobiaceae bacterium]
MANDLIDDDIAKRMIALRRDLHRRPELSNDEHETQKTIRARLEAAGFSGIQDIAGTGLMLDIVGAGGPSNRKVAIRADIDALPIEETSGVPFTSEKPGLMHACGHDAHTSMVYATALALAKNKDRFRGTVRLIFQPAEEAEPLGGRRVVEGGLIDDVDGVIGIHVDPGLETGKIAVAAGTYTLACDTFDITVTGKGSHAAMPEQGVDALSVAITIAQQLGQIVTRERNAYAPLVVATTMLHAGTAHNILPGTAKMAGTIRSGSEEMRQLAHRRIKEIAEAAALMHRATVEVRCDRGDVAVNNHPEMVDLIRRAGNAAGGDGTVQNLPGWTPGDDFGFYSEKKPGVYFRLGIRNEQLGSTYPLHHPSFRLDEAAMPLGARTMAEAALRFLE